MSNNPIIFTDRTDTGIQVTVRKDVDGQDILHSALILLSMILNGKAAFEPVSDIDVAFEDIKALYKAEYVGEESKP